MQCYYRRCRVRSTGASAAPYNITTTTARPVGGATGVTCFNNLHPILYHGNHSGVKRRFLELTRIREVPAAPHPQLRLRD